MDDFIAEVMVFPHAGFDDQVDAMTQYLGWITTNPKPQKRPARGLIQGVDSQGRPIHPPANVPSTETKGIAVQLGSRMMPNAPFPHVKTWVKY